MTYRITCFIAAVGALLMLSGCGGIKGAQYANVEPAFHLREYFDGPITAWGIVQDRSGNIVKRFDIKIVGKWKGDTGTLVEDFDYYDGKTQRRIWTITDLGNGRYTGRADDILNSAAGTGYGNAGRWQYTMNVPVDDTTYRIRFDDWMWLMRDGVLINRSYMKKFGLTVGEITIFMKKDKP
jgi:hypothetical protein